MIILGISAYHGDSAAAIIVNGKVVAAIEEERLNRIKHWAGFPIESISYCLEAAKVEILDVDYISINRNDSWLGSTAPYYGGVWISLREHIPYFR